MRSIAGLLGVAALVAVFVAAALTAAPRSAVDWRAQRAVALESDDWGLAGFVPDAAAWDGLDRESLEPGRFPPVYWGSTLEDAALIRRLVGVLDAHRGRDGHPAILQANYVMASLDWDPVVEAWRTFTLPDWPPAYARPGLWDAVQWARSRGVWRAELHAHFHYDPDRRREAALSSAVARRATERGISLFPGSEQSRELAPWRDPVAMAAELDSSLAIFGRAFGRPAVAVIAPDYHWHDGVEDLWESRGLTVIQAKREQRDPELLPGTAGRIQKYVQRQWARLTRPGRTYLERNCRLEPVQSADPHAIVDRCAAATRAAWERGEPAVVETHRVNFAHSDPAVTATGVRALDAYLAAVAAFDPAPIFVCDTELAQMQRRGVSWRLAGSRLILRNGTRSSRVIAVPALAPAGAPVAGSKPTLYRIPAGGTLTFPVRGIL